MRPGVRPPKSALSGAGEAPVRPQAVPLEGRSAAGSEQNAHTKLAAEQRQKAPGEFRLRVLRFSPFNLISDPLLLLLASTERPNLSGGPFAE